MGVKGLNYWRRVVLKLYTVGYKFSKKIGFTLNTCLLYNKMSFYVEVKNESALGVEGLPPTSTNIHCIYGAVSSNNNVLSVNNCVAACRMKNKKDDVQKRRYHSEPEVVSHFYPLRSYHFVTIHE